MVYSLNDRESNEEIRGSSTDTSKTSSTDLADQDLQNTQNTNKESQKVGSAVKNNLEKKTISKSENNSKKESANKSHTHTDKHENKKVKSKTNSASIKTKKEAHVVVSAYKKNINSTPNKTLLLCNSIMKNRKFEHVKNQLEFSNKKVAVEALSLLRSCEYRVPHEDFDKLYVRTHVSKGYTVKRRRCRAKGASTPIFHRKAHLTISLVKYKIKRGL